MTNRSSHRCDKCSCYTELVPLDATKALHYCHVCAALSIIKIVVLKPAPKEEWR